ncbi:MAG: sorbosone dehydrogenase family protein [Anaerolineae bacterium]
MNLSFKFAALAFVVTALAIACTTPPDPPSPTIPLSTGPATATTELIASTTATFATNSTIEATHTLLPLPTSTDLPSTPTIPVIETKALPAIVDPTLTATSVSVPASPVGVIELEGAQLPAGFSLRKVIEVERPIGLAFNSAGNFYISTQSGQLRIYQTEKNNLKLIDYTNFISVDGFRFLHGMDFHPENGDLYISTAGKISILRDTDNDGLEDQVIQLVEDLPFGLHQNNVPKFGPDGMLYVGVGSTCDACIESDARSGTIMRFDPMTGEGEIVASGLRNPFDVAFHPETGALFATDNGRDDLGDFDPAEELNHIIEGNDYGWPDCWNELEGISCDGTTQATALFAAHSSVNNLLFYEGSSFPSDYTHSLFALNFGSFLVKADTGLQRIVVAEDGQGGYTAETEWFLTMPPNSFPLGLAQGPDGAIYFGDYINGGIWQVSYGD